MRKTKRNAHLARDRSQKLTVFQWPYIGFRKKWDGVILCSLLRCETMISVYKEITGFCYKSTIFPTSFCNFRLNRKFWYNIVKRTKNYPHSNFFEILGKVIEKAIIFDFTGSVTWQVKIGIKTLCYKLSQSYYFM